MLFMRPLLQVHTDDEKNTTTSTSIAGTLKGLESGIKSPLSKTVPKKAVRNDTKKAVVGDKEAVEEGKDQRRRDIVPEVSSEKKVVEMKRIDDGNDGSDDVTTKAKTATYWLSNKAKEKEGVLKLVERVKQRRLSMKAPEEGKGAADDTDNKMERCFSGNNDNNDNDDGNNNDNNDNDNDDNDDDNDIVKEDSIRWESNPSFKGEGTRKRELFSKDDVKRILKALDMETTTSIIIFIIIINIISVATTSTTNHNHHHYYYHHHHRHYYRHHHHHRHRHHHHHLCCYY